MKAVIPSLDVSRDRIVVRDFRLEERGAVARAVCSVRSDGFPETLWFEVPKGCATALAVSEPNWAAVSLLYPAMFLGRTLVVEAPLSPRLLIALRDDLQALLSIYDPRLGRIDVVAEPGEPVPPPGEASRRVATGFSAGVDSFATVRLHTDPAIPAAYRLTDLTVFNVGALGHTDRAEALFRSFCRRCSDYADSRGMGTFFVNGNLDAFYGGVGVEPLFQRTHTLRNAAAALLLQNAVARYLYSSGLPYAEVELAPAIDTARMDPVLLPLLSTERLGLVSAAPGYDRVQKTALIADMPDVQAMLDVCVASHRPRSVGARPNCSKCWKCLRTMLTLEALGKLDAFDAVFDVPFYRRHRARLLLHLERRALEGDSSGRHAIDFARTRGLSVPGPIARAGLGARHQARQGLERARRLRLR